MDVAFHNFIEKNNFLKKPTAQVEEFFKNHKTLYKVSLVINHFFRAIAMITLCTVLPFSFPTNVALCFAGSLFYRLTVENNCAYKFALPAFFGSLTLPLALTSSSQLISGIAFISLASFATSALTLAPFVAYVTYIVLTINYDVNNFLSSKDPKTQGSCCKK